VTAHRRCLPHALLIALCALPLAGRGAAPGAARFTGEPSCASSSCHGGGVGRDQCVIFLKKDVHNHSHEILSKAQSMRLAEGLGIADATKDARCTICHSPFQSVPDEHFVPGVKREQGVSCETCHGAAEGWLRFHTRKDITHDQRIGAGMRETTGLYGHANVCVACHLNIDPQLVKGGHPEMFFELDGQTRTEPPHWKEEQDPWLGPRTWLVGQAAALRELSWNLERLPGTNSGNQAGEQPYPDLQARWQALRWLLKTNPSSTPLPDGPAVKYGVVQSAADRLARSASTSKWSKDSTLTALKRLAAANNEFHDQAISPAEQRRRAELVVLGVDRLWQALKTVGLASPTLEIALTAAQGESKAQTDFDSTRFAAALQQVEVALELLPK
jgi:cytochrome c554/c'-like protein